MKRGIDMSLKGDSQYLACTHIRGMKLTTSDSPIRFDAVQKRNETKGPRSDFTKAQYSCLKVRKSRFCVQNACRTGGFFEVWSVVKFDFVPASSNVEAAYAGVKRWVRRF